MALMGNKVLVSEILELDEKIKLLMKRGENMCTGSKANLRVSVCTVCGKEGQWALIRNHIETNHIQGISHSCNFYDKTFRYTNSVAFHKTKDHKN